MAHKFDEHDPAYKAASLGFGRRHNSYYDYTTTQGPSRIYKNTPAEEKTSEPLPKLKLPTGPPQLGPESATGLGYGHLHDDHYKYVSTQIAHKKLPPRQAEPWSITTPYQISSKGFGPKHKYWVHYTQQGPVPPKNSVAPPVKEKPPSDYMRQVWPKFEPKPLAKPTHAAGARFKACFEPHMKDILGYGETAANDNPDLLAASLGFGRNHQNHMNYYKG